MWVAALCCLSTSWYLLRPLLFILNASATLAAFPSGTASRAQWFCLYLLAVRAFTAIVRTALVICSSPEVLLHSVTASFKTVESARDRYTLLLFLAAPEKFLLLVLRRKLEREEFVRLGLTPVPLEEEQWMVQIPDNHGSRASAASEPPRSHCWTLLDITARRPADCLCWTLLAMDLCLDLCGVVTFLCGILPVTLTRDAVISWIFSAFILMFAAAGAPPT